MFWGVPLVRAGLVCVLGRLGPTPPDVSHTRTCEENRWRAEDGTRTRNLDVGNVALYQLSYLREKDPQAAARQTGGGHVGNGCGCSDPASLAPLVWCRTGICLERVTRFELALPGWKPGVPPTTLHPRGGRPVLLQPLRWADCAVTVTQEVTATVWCGGCCARLVDTVRPAGSPRPELNRRLPLYERGALTKLSYSGNIACWS